MASYLSRLATLTHPDKALRYIALGAIGYWKQDELIGTLAIDSSGNGYHGVYTGAVAPVQPGLRGFDIAHQYSGTGYIDVGDISIFDLTNTAFSIESWIKTSSSNGASIATKFHDIVFPETGGSSGWTFFMEIDGTIRFSAITNDPLFDIQTINSYNDGLWHHIVGIFPNTNLDFDDPDAPPNLWIYVDGIAFGFYTFSTNFNGLSSPSFLKLGQSTIGQIQDTAIYRRALTSAEVTAQYLAGYEDINKATGSHTKIIQGLASSSTVEA